MSAWPELIDDEIDDRYIAEYHREQSDWRKPCLQSDSAEALLRQRIRELETQNSRLAETVRWYQERASERFAELISDKESDHDRH